MLVWIAVTLGAIAVALVAQHIVFAVVLRAVRNRPLASNATERFQGPTRVLVSALVVGSAMASSPAARRCVGRPTRGSLTSEINLARDGTGSPALARPRRHGLQLQSYPHLAVSARSTTRSPSVDVTLGDRT